MTVAFVESRLNMDDAVAASRPLACVSSHRHTGRHGPMPNHTSPASVGRRHRHENLGSLPVGSGRQPPPNHSTCLPRRCPRKRPPSTGTPEVQQQSRPSASCCRRHRQHPTTTASTPAAPLHSSTRPRRAAYTRRQPHARTVTSPHRAQRPLDNSQRHCRSCLLPMQGVAAHRPSLPGAILQLR
uniref:Uncharacterized protein n=1 Tax=Arundo donax TaxID=35708 RepID=A0A0A9G7K9_ARUDO